MTLKSLALTLGGLGLLAGCSNYYQVRDPQSGSVYYTRMITDRAGGAISFEDELTGHDVTLQQSEVARIDRDIYHARTDDDIDIHVDRDLDLDVRPAAARTLPEPDRQVEIRSRGVDLDDDDVDVDVDRDGEDVRIKIDR